ncbi:hypothetical protein K9L63_02740 [Candidatus Gracilibacteria bacterium]|nr:hypothetical protein [Candidatus Gracilibacteria bacterium]
MAKVPLQKIRITGLRSHYKILMQELHRSGTLEIVETPEFIEGSFSREAEDHFGVFDLARIDFAIQFLASRESVKEKTSSILSGGKMVLSEEESKSRLKSFSSRSEEVISECEVIAEELVRSQNEIEKIERRIKLILPFRLFKTPLEKDFSTSLTRTWIGSLLTTHEKKCIETLAGESHLVDVQVCGKEGTRVFLRVTAVREEADSVREMLDTFSFEDFDFESEFSEFFGQKPREILHTLEKDGEEHRRKLVQLEKRVTELTASMEDLKILYDYNAWRKKKNDVQHKMLRTQHLFAFEAWMPEKAFDSFHKWIRNAFVGEVGLERIAPEEGEEVPVLVQNKRGIASFEPITEMFGVPNNQDIDPTVAVAPFFFVFFGLCLSDVGYGAILTSVALWFFLFGKFPQKAREGILLLVLCGIGAVLGGIVLGGYFGITPEQAPQFLLNSNFIAGVEGALPFKGQLIDPMAGSGPIIFLGLAMALGVVQLLTGLVLDFVKRLKNGEYIDAFCDPLPWFLFLVSLIGFALAGTVGLDKGLFKNLALGGAVLIVLTQGRNQKNWLLKPVFGVLGLYNVTGYVSDLLSYSRLMALGLATGVIGFAMNLTAGILGGMMPVKALGFVVAAIVLVFGHGLNFSLSLLGAFVHSGRLQFIEFFGKFFEGGGRKFKPFVREKKYLFFRNS